jgi:hypothetical protein
VIVQPRHPLVPASTINTLILVNRHMLSPPSCHLY